MALEPFPHQILLDGGGLLLYNFVMSYVAVLGKRSILKVKEFVYALGFMGRIVAESFMAIGKNHKVSSCIT